MVSPPRVILTKKPFATFALTYATSYLAHTVRVIASDGNHPLNAARLRKERQKEASGLWWNVTVSQNVSPKSVVRTWVTRRLRTAFSDELAQRGIKHDGTLTTDAGGHLHMGVLSRMLREGTELSLTGSLRLHCKPALVTAKYADVRQETGEVIDILLQRLEKHERAKKTWILRTHTRPFPRPRGQKQMRDS